MSVSYLRYALNEGYLDNWLVAGPQTVALSASDCLDADETKRSVAQEHHMEESGITDLPVERGPLSEGTLTVGDYTGTWSYVVCEEDHYVDLSDSYPRCRYLRAWAYAQLELPSAQEITFVLTAHGPVDVWINDEHVYQQIIFDRDPHSVTFEVSLSEGRNAILIRFEQIGMEAPPHAIALRLPEFADEDASDISVTLPTTIEPVEQRNAFEAVFEDAYLEQAVYSADDDIRVKWDESQESWTMPVAVRLRKVPGRTYAETELPSRPEGGLSMNRAFHYPEGFYHAIVMPIPEQYYEEDVRISRALPFWCLNNNKYSDALYDDLQQRRAEALTHAARHDGLYPQIARMTIGWWDRIERRPILQAIEDIKARHAGSVLDLLGLLNILYRFGDAEEFPSELKSAAEEAILNFRYWHDEPGDDIMDFTGEAESLLFHTCRHLAGQLYPDRVFPNAGETGTWHSEQGRDLARAWLRGRAAYGFAAWDSDIVFAKILTALVHLEEFSETEDLWQMAAVMMDKVFYTLAANSYQGVFGSTHGLTDTSSTLNGMLQATSGVSRLMWGMGAFNYYTYVTVSLASAENYGFPRLIQGIAADLPEAAWHREHHGSGGDAGVDKVTYKTPDYMLCSAQDHRPGERGDREHIWQATLGPAAVVFVNHPANASLDDARRPNFWRGNATLPRVAQWGDLLISIHNAPSHDWMGFTHAYFPLHAFDDYEISDGWAFAQKGDGYLALTASQGLHFMETGPHARRELRSYGRHNVWICHMGRAAQDGTFAEFQQKIRELDVTFEDLSVRCETLRDDLMTFGWEGPLRLNGEVQSIREFKHYESPYAVTEIGADEMIIVYSGQAIRLQLT